MNQDAPTQCVFVASDDPLYKKVAQIGQEIRQVFTRHLPAYSKGGSVADLDAVINIACVVLSTELLAHAVMAKTWAAATGANPVGDRSATELATTMLRDFANNNAALIAGWEFDSTAKWETALRSVGAVPANARKSTDA